MTQPRELTPLTDSDNTGTRLVGADEYDYPVAIPIEDVEHSDDYDPAPGEWELLETTPYDDDPVALLERATLIAATRGPGLTLVADFDPHELRDAEGKWTKNPGALVRRAVRGTVAIYGKSAGHNEVVAESEDRHARLRWDAERRKFAYETRRHGAWTERSADTKTRAYQRLKTGKWYEPEPLRAAQPVADPLADLSPEERGLRVDELVTAVRKTRSSAHLHTTGWDAWTAERDAIHRQIVDDLYARAAHVPNDGRAVIMGGLFGAGKTSTLEAHGHIDPSQFLTLSADEVKEELARRGLVPDVPGHPYLSPMERSTLTHTESRRITQLLADRAYRDRKNVIWDTAMASYGNTHEQLEGLRRAGYDDVTGMFVDVPIDVSIRRAAERYARGVEDFKNGEGYGGRYIPRWITEGQRDGDSSVNRRIFDDLRSQFDDWALYDNSVDGQPARLTARAGVSAMTPRRLIDTAQRRDDLKISYDTYHDDTDSFAGGNVAQAVDLVTLADGSRAVRKTTKSGQEDEARRELLTQRIFNALGVTDVVTTRLDDRSTLTSYVDGKTGSRTIVDAQRGKPLPHEISNNIVAAAVISPGGREIGLVDWLTDNPDRHEGNWIIRGDGSVAGIDHGNVKFALTTYLDYKTQQPRTLAPDSPFAQHWVGYRTNKYRELVGKLRPRFTTVELAEIRTNLEALRPEFERDGVGDWHDFIMSQLTRVEMATTKTKIKVHQP